ncbi:hypothetical protein ITI46_34320, partial [Streptomyces oryzae]
PTLSAAERLASKRKSRKRLKGAPPTPKWRYDFSAPAKKFAPLLWRDEIAVLADGTAVTGLDLHNGLVLLAGSDDLLALNPRDGKVQWRSKRYRKSGRRPYVTVLAAHEAVLWLVVDNRPLLRPRPPHRRRLRPRRRPRTVDRPLPHRLPGEPPPPRRLRRRDSPQERPQRFTASNRKTGHRTWAHTYKSVTTDQPTTIAAPATLVAADKGTQAWTYVQGAAGPWQSAAAGNRVFLLQGGTLTAMPVF